MYENEQEVLELLDDIERLVQRIRVRMQSKKTEELDHRSLRNLTKVEYKTGHLLHSHYRVLSILADGVYKIMDINTKELKILKIAGKEDQVKREEFYNSRRVTTRVCNPRIVGVERVIEEGDAVFGLSPYIPGENLDDILRMRRLTQAEKDDYFRRMCMLVRQLHDCGYIHRDLKPSNFIVDLKDQIHLIDLDISMELDTRGEASVKIPMGTKKYASPEMYKKDYPLKVTADIYSLGVIGREMNQDLRVCERACAKDPGDRYETVEAMLRDLA